MKKPVLGLVAGGALGILDGLSALISAPAVRPEIAMIVVGSMGKGLIAGVLTGWFAKRVNNLPLGIVFGLAMGALFALPFALGKDAVTGQVYFWEIMIPGSLVGLIVGFLTQRYGSALPPRTA